MLMPPYNRATTITKSDTVDIYPDSSLTDAIYVGGAGIVVVVLQDNSTCAITAPAGALIPIACKRVNSTTTSATVMTALKRV